MPYSKFLFNRKVISYFIIDKAPNNINILINKIQLNNTLTSTKEKYYNLTFIINALIRSIELSDHKSKLNIFKDQFL